MKSMALMIIFACASFNMMATDVRIVEIAQAQSAATVVIADAR